MRYDGDELLRLLPSVHGLRDDTRNELRSLLAVIGKQMGILDENLAQLYDDQFVDTCADWVLPYIGDLLGTTPLYAGNASDGDTARSLFPELTGPRFASSVALRARPDLARTIYHRKRKATRVMLEELAHDVTGWAAHVVEFFELLGWTQCIRNHIRPQNKLVDVRRLDQLERLDGAFDVIPHSVDVAPINQDDGRYEIRNVGFFLWRLGAYGIGDPDPAANGLPDADARIAGAAGDFRFHFHPAGVDMPLFSRHRPSETSGVTETRVPAPIRPLLLALDLRDYKAIPAAERLGFSELYGYAGVLQSRRRSISIYNAGALVPPEKICSADLSAWKRPGGDIVAVDTRTGRISFGPGRAANDVRVSYHYGFPADLGGGPYRRASWLIKRHLAEDVIHVSKGGAVTTLFDAVAQWKAGGRRSTIIVVDDDRTYDESRAIALDPPAKKFIAIEAAEGKRPHIRLRKPLVIAGAIDAVVVLSGLLVEGNVTVNNAVGRVRVLHSTLIPVAGTASIIANDPGAPVTEDPLRIEVAFSVTGAIRATGSAQRITVLDSIVDGGGANIAIGALTDAAFGPPAWLERTTILGVTRVREMPLAREVIFDRSVVVERRQSGCVRFSYVPCDDVSRTPRRYRCQPDLEIARAIEEKKTQLGRVLTPAETTAITDFVTSSLVPSYTSVRYGDAAYAQLHLHAPRLIARGAEDGSEMGVYCHLKQPQREDNLHVRLAEYLPFGLQPGIIYVT